MQQYSKEILQHFPLSGTLGADTSNVKTKQMQKVAKLKTPLTLLEIKKIIEDHHQFLSTGGVGGKWERLLFSGIVFGVYVGANAASGTQAALEQRHIPSNIDLQEIVLPFSNFCGVFCRNQDFSDANLSYCLMTDANFENAIFADTNLQNTDFSRSNLRNVSFMNADLRGVDFENCDLTNADFRGAFLENSRFPGAILDNIKY